jgi:prepilin-type N-terminal cleavage/methylation domain-containing protein
MTANSKTMRNRRGFTLTELMITVAIIAILATIAIVGYTKWVQDARLSEGKSMLASVLLQQTQYKDINGGRYATCGKSPIDPEPGPSDKKAWVSSGGTALCWQTLGVKPNTQRVSFQYETRAGVGNCTAPSYAANACSQIPSGGGAWWWAMARNKKWIIYINSVNREPWEVAR